MTTIDWTITLIEQVDDEKFLSQRELILSTSIRYVLPVWAKLERDLCSLRTPMIPFNRFSFCEDIFILMYV